jgi:diadenosine tetraphosphate (Ap4A) HIT family hydrolase
MTSSDCPFCIERINSSEIVLSNDLCLFLRRDEPVLVGSGIIIPRAHRESVFDLLEAEIAATFGLLFKAKELIDSEFVPSGYNVGWNCGAVAGQEVAHAHLHVVPRYSDEPMAGKGIRYWLKQERNKRF